MKNIFAAIAVAGFVIVHAAIGANAQKIETPPLLDGTKVTYYYQNGWGAHVEFKDGKLKYEWIAGPRNGHGNKDLAYRSRKIGERMYVISWLEESHPDYMTLIFNFKNNVMYSSGILRFATKDQTIAFDGGIIQKLELSARD